MNQIAPYERARQLEAQGRSPEEIRATLLREGASEDDVAVVLGSLGKLANPQTTVVPGPLDTVGRVAKSRVTLTLVFAGAVLALSPFLYLAWRFWSAYREGR